MQCHFTAIRRLASVFCAIVACFLFAPGLLHADQIILKSGHKVEGDVLKESADAIYVDINIDVVKIPVHQIQSRSKSKKGEEQPVEVASDSLYKVSRLPGGTIQKLAGQYGEAVVLVQTPGGLGSGFFVNERGYCVTNFHVVEKETRIAVTIFHRNERGEFTKRRIGDVKIVALNPNADLALLKVPRQDDMRFRPVALTPKNRQIEGQDVFAIGNPHGLERSVSQGIISTSSRNVDGLLYIQTTAEINPGNSGGPLFNNRGEVIGVTNMKLQFAEGLGFAIPVGYVKDFLDNHDAYAFDENNPNTGYRYLDAPSRAETRNLAK